MDNLCDMKLPINRGNVVDNGR